LALVLEPELNVIEIKNITKIYKMGDTEVRALNGVSLQIEPGEFVAIMGASGSGKSTMLQILGLLDAPTSGSYKLLGKEVSTLNEDELAAIRSQTLGFIFQMFNLLARTSSLEQVSLPLLYTDSNATHGDPQKLLQMVGLGARLDHKPNELSGGQQQRVAIARALVNQPKVILADEPTGNLDSKSSEEIIEFLGKMNESGITVVLVTHEPDIAAHARRVITMKDGKVLSDKANSRSGTHAPSPGKTKEVLQGAVKSTHTAFNLGQSKAYFRQAFRALLANKVRSGLSVLGILIGVAAVIAMLAVGTGAQKSMEQRLASLGTNLLMLRPGSIAVGGVQQGLGGTSRIMLQDVNAIAKVPMVKRVAPEISGKAQVTFADKNWSTQVTGTTPNYAGMRSAEPIAGHFFTDQDVQKRNRVCLLGLTVIKNLFGDNGNPIGQDIKINRVNFQVIGVLPVKGSNGFSDQDDVIVVPVTTAMYRLFGREYVNMVDIEADTPQDTGPAADAVQSFMMNLKHVPNLPGNQDAFQVRNMADIQATLSATTQIMTILLSSIAAISLLVGGIGIMNIMLVSVTERTREIGLRKAIGARRLDILSQFLIESMAVGIVGGAMGILLGWIIVLGISHFAGWAAIVTPGAVLLASLFSTLVGVLAGLWPAIKASKLSPILALRYE
ncbi:MAG TPA: ABC transporter permease, partial [bacterium]|nr:ABC transporter permease [bacterium]